MFLRFNVVDSLFFTTFKLKFQFKKNDCICKESVTGKLGQKGLIYEKGFHFQKTNLLTHAFTETLTTFDFNCRCD